MFLKVVTQNNDGTNVFVGRFFDIFWGNFKQIFSKKIEIETAKMFLTKAMLLMD